MSRLPIKISVIHNVLIINELQKTPKARTQWGSKLNSIGDGTQPIVYIKVEGH